VQIETLQETARKLEEKVRVQMNGTNMEPLNLLELIDDIERLGLSFKFEEDINKVLLKIVSVENFENRTGKSLHETALLFGILRRHGFDVSQGTNDYLKPLCLYIPSENLFHKAYFANNNYTIILFLKCYNQIPGKKMSTKARQQTYIKLFFIFFIL